MGITQEIEVVINKILVEEIEKLSKALLFYADPNTYILQPPFTSGLPDINFDKGKIARKVLGID